MLCGEINKIEIEIKRNKLSAQIKNYTTHLFVNCIKRYICVIGALEYIVGVQ
jgi:hypothetical protein